MEFNREGMHKEASPMETRVLRIAVVLMVVGAVSLLASACKAEAQPTEPAAGLPNPASVYCQGLGYTEETRTDESGGQYGVCIFSDGSECDSWDFLAGRCGTEYSYCAQQGYTLTGTEDSNIGVCNFPDGSSCDELQYFQGDCAPGQ
jgi:putative hemolysin